MITLIGNVTVVTLNKYLIKLIKSNQFSFDMLSKTLGLDLCTLAQVYIS